MSKTIIVSNRLPLQISIENNNLNVVPSVGGLATGMKSVHKAGESLWIGWPGFTEGEIPEHLQEKVNLAITAEGCKPVNLTGEDMDLYYYGFSNKTIWPLFHYFTEYTEYKKEYWEKYIEVNEKFAEVIAQNMSEGDRVWIHDYQLLLLPKMIKDRFPECSIGFFLHIPFPSFEVFRILPWRTELLEGMLGADLLGFHTYDYERHFFSSVLRLLGHEISFNQINVNNRTVLADIFPMGIDYDKFHDAAMVHQHKSIKDRSELQKELDKHLLVNPEVKLILSIDRLDYTKGIAKRLLAFEYFLENNPDFHGKVTFIMLCVPSRQNVAQYQRMKSEIDELVGRINGKFSTVNWNPIWYFYRSLPFDNLIDLYSSCDVALLTPIRDGMNLVAKEYVASQIDRKGVLILSEMAGAAKEMSEAIVINPNNIDEVSETIKEALLMPDEEQVTRITIMQDRLKRYNVEKWAQDFTRTLEEAAQLQNKHKTKKITTKIKSKLIEQYQSSKNRIMFLDYDGTLVGFRSKPEKASPTEELYTLLDNLSSIEKNQLILVSGRDRETMDKWFGDKKYTLIAEHGAWTKEPGKEWRSTTNINTEWKKLIEPIIDFYVDRTPGTFLEEKSYSYVWHYRKADPELGAMRANELKDQLTSLIANHDLEILEGNKVVEIKNSGTNKGKAAMAKIGQNQYDFILSIGDDHTDEYMFRELPANTVSIKVGVKNTIAAYSLESYKNVLEFLEGLNSACP